MSEAFACPLLKNKIPKLKPDDAVTSTRPSKPNPSPEERVTSRGANPRSETIFNWLSKNGFLI